MKKFILLTGSLTIALGASVAFSAGAPVSNIFASGQPAVAADVNTNFQELADRIDNVPGSTIFDYRDYLSSASSMTYDVSGDLACGDEEVRSFVRTPAGSNTDLDVTVKKSNGGTLCSLDVFRITNTPTERLLKERDKYDLAGAITDTFKLDSPITVRTSTMAQGSSFADAASINRTSGGVTALDGVHINSAYASGIETETITVPSGTYDNCLKIYEKRNSRGLGGLDSNRIYWFCKGVGMVKRINYREDSDTYSIAVLASTAP